MKIGEAAAQAAVNIQTLGGESVSCAAKNVPAAPTVDLIFDAKCPNVADARATVRSALIAAGFQPKWREWLRDGAITPPQLRGFGSPTILVNGFDVSGGDRAAAGTHSANSCRLYRHEGRLRGVPPLRAVAAALLRGSGGRWRASGSRGMGVLGSVSRGAVGLWLVGSVVVGHIAGPFRQLPWILG